MPKDHTGGVRGFFHLAESWYWKSQRRDRPDEINIGIYYPPDGGTSGEFLVVWDDLSGQPVARLQAFDDAWSALVLFQDVLAKMAEHDTLFGDDTPSITPAAFCELLKSCGVVDMTRREDPYAKTDAERKFRSDSKCRGMDDEGRCSRCGLLIDPDASTHCPPGFVDASDNALEESPETGHFPHDA